MRNESYKALLDHAARDSTPMQVNTLKCLENITKLFSRALCVCVIPPEVI